MHAPLLFAHDRNRRMNWRQVERADVTRILQGDLKDLDALLPDLAQVDLEQDGLATTNPEVFKAFKVMQVGLQYLSQTKNHLLAWCQTAHDSAQHEAREASALQEATAKQRTRLRKLQKELHQLETREVHYHSLVEAVQSVQTRQVDELKQSDLDLLQSLAEPSQAKPSERRLEKHSEKRVEQPRERAAPLAALLANPGSSLSLEELEDEKLASGVAVWEPVR